ncbi:hypothetical protein FJTKL_11099 [Diaporthe vaccinii]|uniref:Uncharacterized protein n=1 Tax=Diaporthe vaccinii TaxID=105482 RepID=A0ABR4EHY2_9PEZI
MFDCVGRSPADCNQRRPINTQVNANSQVLQPWVPLSTSRSFRRRSRAMFCSSSCESAAGKYVETEPFN